MSPRPNAIPSSREFSLQCPFQSAGMPRPGVGQRDPAGPPPPSTPASGPSPSAPTGSTTSISGRNGEFQGVLRKDVNTTSLVQRGPRRAQQKAVGAAARCRTAARTPGRASPSSRTFCPGRTSRRTTTRWLWPRPPCCRTTRTGCTPRIPACPPTACPPSRGWGMATTTRVRSATTSPARGPQGPAHPAQPARRPAPLSGACVMSSARAHARAGARGLDRPAPTSRASVSRRGRGALPTGRHRGRRRSGTAASARPWTPPGPTDMVRGVGNGLCSPLACGSR